MFYAALKKIRLTRQCEGTVYNFYVLYVLRWDVYCLYA